MRPSDMDTVDAPALLAGRYVIEGTLARGGMGVILAARDLRGGQVAVKRITDDRRLVSTTRFLREARIAASLDSEHVVRVLDSGMDGGSPFLVMERLVGTDLGAELEAHGPMSVTEVADILLQVCSGLSHAHAAGVVHRDIKPSNLFRHRGVDGTRVVKVLDFGISKSIASEGEATLTRSREGTVGSPPFMSPEQIRDSHDVDLRTDIWSLGVVAYRLLTAEMPFEGDSVGSLFAAVLELSPRRPSQHALRGADAFEDVIAKCLAKDRAERFDDVGALALAVAPYASQSFRALANAIVARLRDSLTLEAEGVRQQRKERTATITGRRAYAALKSLESATSTRARPRQRRILLGVLGGIALACASVVPLRSLAYADGDTAVRAPHVASRELTSYVERRPLAKASPSSGLTLVAAPVAQAWLVQPAASPKPTPRPGGTDLYANPY